MGPAPILGARFVKVWDPPGLQPCGRSYFTDGPSQACLLRTLASLQTRFRFPAAQGKRPGSASSFPVGSGASALLAKSQDAGGFCSPARDPAGRGRAGPGPAIRLARLSLLRLLRPGVLRAAPGEARRRSSLFYEVSGRCQTQL